MRLRDRPAVAYEEADFRAVKALLVSRLAPALVRERVSAGWAGLLEDNETAAPLKPSADRSRPAMLAYWVLDYEGRPRTFFDPDSDVIREGVVKLALFVQPGARRGPALAFWRLVREVFAGWSEEWITFFPESATVRHGQQSGYSVEELAVRFIATGMPPGGALTDASGAGLTDAGGDLLTEAS